MDFWEKVYNLSKFNANYACKMKAQTYNVDIVAMELTSGRTNRRENPKYKIADDLYFDLTSSCNKEETKYWLSYFIANSLAYGIQEQDTDWAYMFLAAYDQYKHLEGDTESELYLNYR